MTNDSSSMAVKISKTRTKKKTVARAKKPAPVTTIPPQPAVAPTPPPKAAFATFHYAVGRRKEASARVRVLSNGEGTIVVNGKELRIYFPQRSYQDIVESPLKLLGVQQHLGVTAKILGGGLKGQAEALRLGIARALVVKDPSYRTTLRKAGYLTRDPRVKERKKYGLKRARRAPQWQKR